MRVFVTGGNGFIGSRVVRRLVTEGHTVRCLLRQTSRTHRVDDLEFERHLGDLLTPEALQAGMVGCDAVIHLASISAWDQIRSPRMRQVVVEGSGNVLDAAVASGGPRVLFISSLTAVGGTPSPALLDEDAAFELPPDPFIYAHAKRDAEALCMTAHAERGLPVLILSPCEVWGPDDDDFITAAYARDTLKDWPALTVRGGTALAHVDDIAGGIVAGLTRGRPGQRYILGGENIHAPDITRGILAAAGQKKPVLQLPNGLTLAAINFMARLGLPTPIHPDLLAHAVLYWFADCSKAERELGYTYRPAKETIQDVVDWLKGAGHA